MGEVYVLIGVPGSGKTAELIRLARRLAPRRVALTFTRSVREELVDRGFPGLVRSFAGWAQSAVQSRTQLRVYPPEYAWQVWRRVWRELVGPCPEKFSPWVRTQVECAAARDAVHAAVHVYGEAWLDAVREIDERVGRVAEAYQAELEHRQALDHDLALLYTVYAGLEPPWNERRVEAQTTMVVDEAQDLSPLMWGLLRRWGLEKAPRFPHVKVEPVVELYAPVALAGDPMQTIYHSFHGANPASLGFVARFADRVERASFSRRLPARVARLAERLASAAGYPTKIADRGAEGLVEVVEDGGRVVEAAASVAAALARNVGQAVVGVVVHRDDTAVEVARRLAEMGVPPCSVKRPNPLHIVDAEVGEKLTQLCAGWREGVFDTGRGRVSVVVDTVLAWKGLEADYVVYVPDANSATDVEFLHAAYVAVTRAREGVYVVLGDGADPRAEAVADAAAAAAL